MTNLAGLLLGIVLFNGVGGGEAGAVCAYDLDGSDDYLYRNEATVSAYPMTICAWIKVESATTAAQMGIASVGNQTDGNDQVVLEWGSVTNSACSAADTPYDCCTGSGTGDCTNAVCAMSRRSANSRSCTEGITRDTWQHACAVYASALSRVGYINGDAAPAETTDRSFSTTPNKTVVGARTATSSGIQNYFNGKVAHVAYWNIALTSGEVTALAGGDNPLTAGDNDACTGSTAPYACCTGSGTGTCAGPVAYYPFTTGSSTTDEAGAFDLTASGSPSACSDGDVPTVDAAP